MRVISLDIYNQVISVKHVKNDYQLEAKEIQSDTGEIGQIMQADGTFTNPEPEPVEPQPTLEDKINYIYYKQMGVI